MEPAGAVNKPLFTHADFYIFEKPPGVSFHNEQGDGFFASLVAAYPNETLFPVHRLDRITSGLLLVARNAEAAKALSALFEQGKIQKTYLALSDRKPTRKQGLIKGDMERTRNGSWKLLRTQANPAITRFTSESVAPGLRLFTLKPQTGKTHQLRVMMKAIGAPVLGDERYGGTPAERGYLHASGLEFEWKGEKIISHLPPAFAGSAY